MNSRKSLAETNSPSSKRKNSVQSKGQTTRKHKLSRIVMSRKILSRSKYLAKQVKLNLSMTKLVHWICTLNGWKRGGQHKEVLKMVLWQIILDSVRKYWNSRKRLMRKSWLYLRIRMSKSLRVNWKKWRRSTVKWLNR